MNPESYRPANPVTPESFKETTNSLSVTDVKNQTNQTIQTIGIIGSLIVLIIIVALSIVIFKKRGQKDSMEKENLSGADISKKLIWQYILASLVFGFISSFIITIATRYVENVNARMILQIILSTATVFLYVWIGSRNIIRRYYIRKEDVNIIIRNISIFFVVMIVIMFFMNYNSYHKLIQKEAKIYSVTDGYDVNDIVDEAINRYQNNESTADMYTSIKQRQEEKFKKEFSEKYGYVIFIPSIYSIALYGTMIFLQRRWLLKAAQ